MFFSGFIFILLVVQGVGGQDGMDAESIRIMCTNEYSVSHDRQEPDGDMYGIDYMQDDSATPETCQDWCTEDVTCRSVLYWILEYMYEYMNEEYDYEERMCVKFSISIQELKDTGRDDEIYNETDTDYTTFITYDRDCVNDTSNTTLATSPTTTIESIRCMYTNEYSVSHDRQKPNRGMYYIDYMQDDSATPETCWDWCTEDVTCRSVVYVIHISGDRYCDKFSISIQQLKDTGKDNVIYTVTDTDMWPTYITYDRDCVESIPIMCTNEYSVSHDRLEPDRDMYGIDYMEDNSATPETCWEYCNKDVTCRSVLYEIDSDGYRYCTKFSISVQQLKDTGRDDEIYNETDTDIFTTYITYDRDCGL